MNQIKQRWSLGLVSVFFGACVALLPLQALAQSQTQNPRGWITPIIGFDSVYRQLTNQALTVRFSLELHLEPGAASESGHSTNQLRTMATLDPRIVLIVGRWKDLPKAVGRLIDSKTFGDTLIAVVTDAKEHLVDGRLQWPAGTPDWIMDRVKGQSIFAPNRLGGPERVASSATTLFLAAAKSPRCKASTTHVWAAPAMAWGVPADQKPVGFSATAELLLRSAKAGAKAMKNSTLAIYLPHYFGSGSANAALEYSNFESTGNWLELSTAERVVMGLGVELLPQPRGLEIKVLVHRDIQFTSWQDFKVDYLRANGVASYLSESVLQGNQPGSLNETVHHALRDWSQTIERTALLEEPKYQERVEAITREAARRLERAQAFGRFVELLAAEVKERALPTASLSFGEGSGPKDAVIPVNWVPVGSSLPSTRSVTLGEYRSLLERAIEASARINAIKLKTPEAYRLPNAPKGR